LLGDLRKPLGWSILRTTGGTCKKKKKKRTKNRITYFRNLLGSWKKGAKKKEAIRGDYENKAVKRIGRTKEVNHFIFFLARPMGMVPSVREGGRIKFPGTKKKGRKGHAPRGNWGTYPLQKAKPCNNKTMKKQAQR